MSRYVAFIVVLFFSLFTAYSQGYYADIGITVSSSGDVVFNGNSNYPFFQDGSISQEYTSKQGKYWVLNISTKEEFDDFIFELTLPKGAEINYIKTTPSFRIDNDGSRIVLIGTGENKPFTLIVQYSVKNNASSIGQGYYILAFLAGLIFALCFLLVLFILKRNNDRNKPKIVKKIEPKIEENKENSIIVENLPERQRAIYDYIEKKGKVTQKELEEKMGFPKSSLSRNIASLASRNIIEKSKSGQTNYLSLKK